MDDPSTGFALQKFKADNATGVVAMCAALQDLLRAFQDLPEAEKHELASAVLRWEASSNSPTLNDDEFVAVAEGVFLGLDRDEGWDA